MMLTMRRPSFALLQRPNFRLLLLTRMCASMALQAQAVIVGWQIYSLTGDPFMLGLIGLAEALPAIISALFSGHVVDTGNPKIIYRICFGMLALNIITLTALSGGIIPLPTQDLIPIIFAGVIVSGLARSFTMPSSFSMLPRIVTRAEIPAASGWLSSGFQVAAVSGPAIAGLIYGGYGVLAAWTLPALLMSAAFVLSLSLHVDMPARLEAAREKMTESIKTGWRFILKSPVLLSVMSLDMFAVLFGGAVALLPVYADQILHVGSEGLGALRAAPALGSGLMALWLATHPMHVVSGKRLLWTVVGFGVSIIVFGVSHIFWLSFLALAFSGGFDCVSMVIRQTLMQWLTPDTMRGRVSSVNSMFIISSNEIGAFESGTAAKLLGLVPSVVFGGVMTLVVAGLTAWANPQLRRMEIHPDEPGT